VLDTIAMTHRLGSFGHEPSARNCGISFTVVSARIAAEPSAPPRLHAVAPAMANDRTTML
jgi:hypothetical protein